jgi:hypothetical protein
MRETRVEASVSVRCVIISSFVVLEAILEVEQIESPGVASGVESSSGDANWSSTSLVVRMSLFYGLFEAGEQVARSWWRPLLNVDAV